ncbi:hypothetical protein JCM16418_465 [Paenibacillus pini JCM 16418]|uniref:Uncharacterized protein n=1 Tax=Paenibacillus pini JCM 16418 TaxID=1236976 RepID=W7YP95_9BACL|nr:hypothetical protein JCM16418_465 [Paenibacillus pini JCM 16418]
MSKDDQMKPSEANTLSTPSAPSTKLSPKGRQTQRLDKVLTHLGYGSRSILRRR